MATQTIANLNKLFKDRYWPAREKKYGETFLRSNALLARLKPRDAGDLLVGRKLIVPIHTRRSRAAGARAESGALPAAGLQAIENFEFTVKSLYETIVLSGLFIDLSMTNEAVFWKGVNLKVENHRKDLSDATNRQCYNNGSGILATFTSTANSATQTVDDSTWLEAEMEVVVAVAADGTSGVTRTINAVNHVTRTVTLSSAVDVTAGTHAIFPPGLTSGNVAEEYGNAIQGLEAAISATEAYGGLSAGQRATAEWSQATVEDLDGGLPDEMMMIRMAHACEHRGGGKISMILTSPGVWRLLGKELVKSSFWPNPVTTVKFGYTAIQWQSVNNRGGIDILADPHCPRGRMYFIDESTFYLAQVKPLGWRDYDGQTWRASQTADTYQAELMWRGNVICVNPRANGKFINVASDDSTL